MDTANKKVRAAFQGERGAFSEDAARQLLGDEAETVAYRSFDDMFDAVSSGDAAGVSVASIGVTETAAASAIVATAAASFGPCATGSLLPRNTSM